MLQGSPDPPPSSGLQLRVTQGAAAGKVYPLDAETLSVGRSSPGVESVAGFLSIDDDTVSRLHAELRWDAEQGAYILTNRSVTNPTTVNHVLVESARLQPGDVIVMGECVCVLQPQASVSQRSERPRSGASGTLALTDRPPLFLESVAGNRHPITGLVVALGGTLVEEGAPPATGFDQEICLPEPDLPARMLSLAWRDLAHAFEIRCLSSAVPVVLLREKGGLQWRAPLSPQLSSQLRQGDAIRIGEIELRVGVGPV